MDWFTQILIGLMLKKVRCPHGNFNHEVSRVEAELTKLCNVIFSPLVKKENLNLGIKFYILHQMHLRLYGKEGHSVLITKEDNSVSLYEIQKMLIGALIASNKAYCEDRIWLVDFKGCWTDQLEPYIKKLQESKIPITELQLLSIIEHVHLEAIDYSAVPSCDSLLPIFMHAKKTTLQSVFFDSIESGFQDLVIQLMQKVNPDLLPKLMDMTIKKHMTHSVLTVKEVWPLLFLKDEATLCRIIDNAIIKIFLKFFTQEKRITYDFFSQLLKTDEKKKLGNLLEKLEVKPLLDLDLGELFKRLKALQKNFSVPVQFTILQLRNLMVNEILNQTNLSIQDLKKVLCNKELITFNKILTHNGINLEYHQTIQSLMQVIPEAGIVSLKKHFGKTLGLENSEKTKEILAFLNPLISKDEMFAMQSLCLSNAIHQENMIAIQNLLRLQPKKQVEKLVSSLSQNEIAILHGLLFRYAFEEIPQCTKQLANLKLHQQMDCLLWFLYENDKQKLLNFLDLLKIKPTLFASSPYSEKILIHTKQGSYTTKLSKTL